MSLPKEREIRKANFTQAKVLLVEDKDDHYLLIERAMKEYLPEVSLVRVSTPVEALSLLDDWCTQEWEMPKLILQDLYLPTREDGWHLLGKIKSMPAPGNQIPVIILSSSDYREDIEEVYQRGGTSYLVKPVSFMEWQAYFQELRAYWWETVTLPPLQFSVV